MHWPVPVSQCCVKLLGFTRSPTYSVSWEMVSVCWKREEDPALRMLPTRFAPGSLQATSPLRPCGPVQGLDWTRITCSLLDACSSHCRRPVLGTGRYPALAGVSAGVCWSLLCGGCHHFCLQQLRIDPKAAHKGSMRNFGRGC